MQLMDRSLLVLHTHAATYQIKLEHRGYTLDGVSETSRNNILYGNNYGIVEGPLSRLQSVQNAAARLLSPVDVLLQLHCTACNDQVGDVGPPRLQELHRPTCPTSVTLHYLLEYALCAQLTLGHVYLVTHTMVTVFVVLQLPVLVCGTVCRCSCENRTFRSTVLKLC